MKCFLFVGQTVACLFRKRVEPATVHRFLLLGMALTHLFGQALDVQPDRDLIRIVDFENGACCAGKVRRIASFPCFLLVWLSHFDLYPVAFLEFRHISQYTPSHSTGERQKQESLAGALYKENEEERP